MACSPGFALPFQDFCWVTVTVLRLSNWHDWSPFGRDISTFWSLGLCTTQYRCHFCSSTFRCFQLLFASTFFRQTEWLWKWNAVLILNSCSDCAIPNSVELVEVSNALPSWSRTLKWGELTDSNQYSAWTSTSRYSMMRLWDTCSSIQVQPLLVQIGTLCLTQWAWFWIFEVSWPELQAGVSLESFPSPHAGFWHLVPWRPTGNQLRPMYILVTTNCPVTQCLGRGAVVARNNQVIFELLPFP